MALYSETSWAYLGLFSLLFVESQIVYPLEKYLIRPVDFSSAYHEVCKAASAVSLPLLSRLPSGTLGFQIGLARGARHNQEYLEVGYQKDTAFPHDLFEFR